MSCSLIVSGISVLTGVLMYFPVRDLASNSIHEYFEAEATLAVITSRLFERSLTATTSPGFT